MVPLPSATGSQGLRNAPLVQPSPIFGYGMAIVLAVIALLLRLWLQPVLGDRIPFATFFAALALTAWFGGFGPCLLAIALGALGSWYFVLEPRHTFAFHLPYQVVGLVTFVITGLVIAGFSHRMRSAIEESERRAQQAQEGQQVLQALLDNVPAGITMAGGPPHFEIVAVSKYAQNIIGSTAQSVVGMSAGEHIRRTPVLRSDRVTAAEKEEVPIYRATHFGEVVKNEQWVLRRHDGQCIDVLIDTVPIRDAHGAIIGGIGCWRDVTEQRTLVLRLAESEQRFRATFEQAAVGMAQIGLDGKWLRVNDRLCEMLGYRREELLTLSSLDLTHPEDRETAFSRMQSLLIGDVTSYTLEKRYVCLDGSVLWVSHTVALVRKDGEAQYFIAVTEDIGKRKAAEEEIRRLHDELERRVEERTAELAAANQELEAFSYSVSHDLQAPLRSIGGFAQIIFEDYGTALPAEARGYLGRVRQSAKHMGQLIDDLLAFSRLGRRPLKTHMADLRMLAEQCVMELKGIDPERAVNVSVGALPSCQCDPILFKQVLTNLLSNAFKFTRQAENPQIEVGSLSSENEKVIYVRDNGLGIDMRYADKIFDVFERLHRAEEYEGTGVGLSIVKRIVERHGGRVWVESQLGQGATFYFTLTNASLIYQSPSHD